MKRYISLSISNPNLLHILTNDIELSEKLLKILRERYGIEAEHNGYSRCG